MDKLAARKLQRQQLIELRNALVDRDVLEGAIRRRVLDWLQQSDLHAVGFYFPIRGEPDLREAIGQWLAAREHRMASLPVIQGNQLEFHTWTVEAPMQAGAFDIPVPAQGRIVQPQCLLIPCVGFDRQLYRLGYGGGYYDRTLAAVKSRPLVVGIAFDAAKVDSIDPRPHDVQLDVVITEAATY